MKPTRTLRINPGRLQSTHHRMNVKGFASRPGGSCSKEASRHFLVAAAGPTLDIHPVARRLAANRVNATVQARQLPRKLLQHKKPTRRARNQSHISKPFRLDFYVRQRLLFRLDFYVRQRARAVVVNQDRVLRNPCESVRPV